MGNSAPVFTNGGTIVRASQVSDGTPANASSYEPSLSADGSKVVFSSTANNLGPYDATSTQDIYLKDLTTGAVTLVSTNASGGGANSSSWQPVVSADGTKVVFQSNATNLVGADTNGSTPDIFIKDLTTGQVTLLSATAAGVQGNGASSAPVLSPDGTKVAFTSSASNLVAGDKNNAEDVFIKDLTTGVITRVSTDANGAPGVSSSFNPVFSPDGTKIAFASYAPNLVAGDTVNTLDLFVKDLTTGVVTRVSTSSTGVQGNIGDGYQYYKPAFSPDGTKIVFTSTASNLVPNDVNGAADIFVKDLTTGATTLVSSNTAGVQGNGASSYNPYFSPDGTKVLFVSAASNLVPGDTNGLNDVFMKDLATGEVTRVSTTASGDQLNGISGIASFSSDGTKLVFMSSATNIVPGDSNGLYDYDVFVKDLSPVSSASAKLTDDAAKTALTASGKIYFTDADAADAHTVSIKPIDGAIGSVTANVVRVAGGADHVDWTYSVDESLVKSLKNGESRTYSFALTVDDGHGGTATRPVAVTVTGVNDAPVISSAEAVSFAENGTSTVMKVAATDEDGDAITWSLSGADAGLFTLAADGTLAFKAAPDFEAPKDAGGNNVYDVVLNASDGQRTASKAVAITVTDVAENKAPEWVSGGSITRVSTNASGEQGNGASFQPVFSPDGTKVMFWSSASNLAGGTDDTNDLFVKDLATGAVTLVTKNNPASMVYAPQFAPDGTKVAFEVQIYSAHSGPSISVKDVATGQTIYEGNGGDLTFSADGTKVAFAVSRQFLGGDGVEQVSDIMVKDFATGAITNLTNFTEGGSYSSDPVFSPDGTKVAFGSNAPSLVPGDTNKAYDIFVKDLTTGVITRISTDATGAQGNSGSGSPVFSPDGTKVMFTSTSSNLVPGDTNNTTDIFLKDLATGTITLVASNAAGAPGNASSANPIFSPDGSKVVFVSSASNLVPGDTNNTADIFIKDLVTGAITRVSTDATGAQANSTSSNPVFSPDGTKLMFSSSASNLVSGDTNNTADIFVKDLGTGAITRVSTDAAGAQGNSASSSPGFSPDGTKALFSSEASNLTPGDTNHTGDIFIKDLTPTSNTAATLTDDATKAALTASGALYFTDANASDTHTVSIAPHSGALGTLTATVVPVADGPDHIDWSYAVDTDAIAALNAGQSHTDTFTLALNDGHGGIISKDVTVTLNGINDAPVITAPATVSFAENGTGAVLVAAAVDPEASAITWSLSGADAALFAIGTDGRLAFKSAPDFEAPKDAGGNNVYDVVLNASDGQITTSKAVAITVTSVNEAPVITAAASVAYAENGTGAVMKAAAADPEGSAITWTLGGTDAALFTLAPDGTLTFKTAPNYEAPADANHDNVYDLVLKAGDGTLTGQKALSVSVTDVAENTAPPPIIASDAGGTLSGTSGSDIIVGGKGSDVLLAGDGNDTVSGGDGFNMLYGEAGNDTLNGGKDFDQLFGGAGDDIIHGGAGNDMMWGEGGHNKLYGDAGDDQIFAGTDGDWLEGGSGRDMLFGGIGADKFVIGGPNANDADQFFNFTSGTDKVVIHGSDYGLGAGALDAAHFQTGAAASGSAGTFIYNPTLGSLAWDADGAGSAAAVTVATVIGGNLALNDLILI